MTENQTQEFLKTIMGGYTEEQLQAAFNKVKNPDDWKAAIDTVVVDETDEELECIKFAVQFYTSTECELTELEFEKAPEGCDVQRATKVKAVGYRMGPAGP